MSAWERDLPINKQQLFLLPFKGPADSNRTPGFSTPPVLYLEKGCASFIQTRSVLL